jgi:hypothetical protein
MHIVFGRVGYWQIPIIKLFKYFKFKVFYISIGSKSKFQQNEIAAQLKKKNITPLPIEFEKQIPKKSYSLVAGDSDEVGYKKNVKMIPDKILIKYCNLFSINEKEVKKLRLLIQDIIAGQQLLLSGKIGIWSNLYPSEKIIFISFKFIDFFTSDVAHNITKIIIPIDIFSHFIKIIKKLFWLLPIFKNKEHKGQVLNSQNFVDLEKKSVAFVTHKGTVYGTGYILFQKTLYYSSDKNSCLNKYNILHMDYSGYLKPEQDMHWVCLNKVKVSSIKFFFRTILACMKTFYLIRSWSTFLVWVLFIQQYAIYIKYCEIIKKFKKLKIAIIDYDCLCPKTLLLAFKKNNIKTVATQERFITTFYTSYSNVVLDTYYTASEHTANFVKNSKYYDVNNVIPMGQYRSDYISLYKNEIIPEEISKAKNSGKKILLVFGNHSSEHWFESYTSPLINWTAQNNFLEDCIKLSKKLNNTYIILRYKSLNWLTNKYFKNILNKINNCENIIISNNYKEYYYSYKLCANADLVIAKHTSIADECLSNEIPVLFHEYTHNMKKAVLNPPNYLPSQLICNNFEDLLQKSESILFSDSSKIEEEVKKLNKTIYYVKEKGNIKNKIISDCMRIIGNR